MGAGYFFYFQASNLECIYFYREGQEEIERDLLTMCLITFLYLNGSVTIARSFKT